MFLGKRDLHWPAAVPVMQFLSEREKVFGVSAGKVERIDVFRRGTWGLRLRFGKS